LWRGGGKVFPNLPDENFSQKLNRKKRVYGEYQVSGVPETFLVDRNGQVLERFVGPQNWDDPRYARAIRRTLAAGGRADTAKGG
jgi:glutathione peroxidase-family protein